MRQRRRHRDLGVLFSLEERTCGIATLSINHPFDDGYTCSVSHETFDSSNLHFVALLCFGLAFSVIETLSGDRDFPSPPFDRTALPPWGFVAHETRRDRGAIEN